MCQNKTIRHCAIWLREHTDTLNPYQLIDPHPNNRKQFGEVRLFIFVSWNQQVKQIT